MNSDVMTITPAVMMTGVAVGVAIGVAVTIYAMKKLSGNRAEQDTIPRSYVFDPELYCCSDQGAWAREFCVSAKKIDFNPDDMAHEHWVSSWINNAMMHGYDRAKGNLQAIKTKVEAEKFNKPLPSIEVTPGPVHKIASAHKRTAYPAVS